MFTLEDIHWAATEVSTRATNPAGIESVGIWHDTVQVDYLSGVTLVADVSDDGELIRLTVQRDMGVLTGFTETSLDTFKNIVRLVGKVVEVDA